MPKIKDKKSLVLIVTEEPDLINRSKKFLKLGNYETITSTNSKEALKIIKNRYNEISIIFLEVMLPHRGAITLLEEIKSIEKYKAIRVVLFTNKSFKTDGLKRKKLGADLYITKPFMGKSKNDNNDIDKVSESVPYCKYCGSVVAKGESICHVCGNKIE